MSVVKMLEAREQGPQTFGQFLRAELDKRGWTPNFFCSKLGRSTGGWIYNIINDKALPARKSLVAIANALEIDVNIVRQARGGYIVRLPGDGPLPPVLTETQPQTQPQTQFSLELDGDKMRLVFSGHVSFETAGKMLELLHHDKIL